MRVKEKHRRNVFFYSPGKCKSLKLIQEEINLNGPITMNRLISEINSFSQRQLPAQQVSEVSSALCSKEGENT